MSSISALLVDDHPMIRDAMRTYFADEAEIEITSEANNGFEALKALETNQYDIIITDLNMPDMNGITLMERLKEQSSNQKVLVVSMINDPLQIKKMMSLGALGYVLKNSPKEELVQAIKSVAKGDQYFSQEVMGLIIENFSGKKHKPRLTLEVPLTKREKEVLKLIMDEKTNQQIAEKLFISVRTVEAHKRNLLEKTGCKTVAGLAIYAYEKGLV